MKCKCIKQLEERIVFHGFNGRSVEAAEFTSIAFKGAEMTLHPTSQILVRYKGFKKDKTVTVFHNFCPFCGVELQTKNPKAHGVPA